MLFRLTVIALGVLAIVGLAYLPGGLFATCPTWGRARMEIFTLIIWLAADQPGFAGELEPLPAGMSAALGIEAGTPA